MNKKYIIPFLDALFCLLLVFVCIVMLLKSPETTKNYMQQSAIFALRMTWNRESDTDMDLWAEDPQHHIVSFNRREGGEGSRFALMRDNLGAKLTELINGKLPPENEEIIYIRGVFPGEYIVNAHCFRKREPAPLKVKITLVKVKSGEIITQKEETFEKTGEEWTFFRFVCDQNEQITSINSLSKLIATVP